MDFSKLKGEIYFKNKFIKAKNAKIHVLNHSLHFASSVFEGIRVYNNKILFLDNHIYRLIESSKLMGLKLKFNFNKIVNLNKLIIKKNNIKFGYIRPLVFRSSHSMSPDTVKCKTYLAIAAWKWQNLFDDQSGIKLNIGKKTASNILESLDIEIQSMKDFEFVKGVGEESLKNIYGLYRLNTDDFDFP